MPGESGLYLGYSLDVYLFVQQGSDHAYKFCPCAVLYMTAMQVYAVRRLSHYACL